VGAVLKKSLDDKGRPILHVVIKPEFRNVISANTRFWRTPATSIKVGPGVLQVELESVEALVQGGVEFDSFGATIKSEVPVSEFQLFDDKKTAQAESTPIRIRFDNGRGLVAGRSELRYLGVPVGIVEEVETKDQHIWVVARLNSGYEFLRTQDAIYSVVRPNISLQGITGLETLVSGVYIECTAGSSKKMATSFVGKTTFDSEEITPTGLSVKLKAEGSPINPGAAIYYRGISVGRITEKSLSQDGRDVVLTAVINRKYSHLIHENTKFWDASGLKATLGFLKFRIQTGSVIVPDGQICFATPDNAAMGPAARDGDTFPLYPEPQADWAKWNPSIPTNE
jgi:paraquat-inducible protein B